MSRRVIVVGESGSSGDDYDARAIAELIRALRPAWIVQSRLRSLCDQESAAHPVDCLFNHEDTDAVEPSHVGLAETIESTLAAAGCPGHAAVCAWELEAWFLMWPEAIEATRHAWRVPMSLRSRNVGKIADPEKALAEKLAPGKPLQVRYQEKHAPEVAAQIASRIKDRSGSSKSYDRFVETLSECEARAS